MSDIRIAHFTNINVSKITQTTCPVISHAWRSENVYQSNWIVNSFTGEFLIGHDIINAQPFERMIFVNNNVKYLRYYWDGQSTYIIKDSIILDTAMGIYNRDNLNIKIIFQNVTYNVDNTHQKDENCRFVESTHYIVSIECIKLKYITAGEKFEIMNNFLPF